MSGRKSDIAAAMYKKGSKACINVILVVLHAFLLSFENIFDFVFKKM